jgi:hypothetical protein
MYFKEDSHQYFNEKGEEYKSVSYLAKLLDKKDESFWKAKKVKIAKQRGITVAELTAEWDKKKLLGTTAGTIIHNDREQDLIDNEFSYMNVVCKKKECPIEDDGYKWSIPIVQLENNTVYPELMIYDHNYKLCGQSDKVIVKDNTIYVEDYKTDKSIERRSFGSEWGQTDRFKDPVSHLEDCNYNMYSIKMSCYMFMLWKANKHLKIGKLILEHLSILRDKEGIPILNSNGRPTIMKTERIEVPYLRKEVRDIFNAYKEGRL